MSSLPLGVNDYINVVNGTLQETGIPSMVHFHLIPGVPGKDSGFTATLSKMK